MLGYLYSFGVTEIAVNDLTEGVDNAKVQHDLNILEGLSRQLVCPITGISEHFSSYLWTLAGEVIIPLNLGWQPLQWPLLLFPHAIEYEPLIIKFVEQNGGCVSNSYFRTITILNYVCLYGGKPWYPSLRSVYEEKFSDNSLCKVIWIELSPKNHKTTLAAIARKLQVNLRPTLPEIEVRSSKWRYPGIVKAFHMPCLNNIGIQNEIFKTYLCEIK